ncbi:HD domain-containing protein [Pseudalkalibacillus sp. Hm43]|uniref:HD domain-containing protein n=1 Tax=Pseudalkalibacillus sp. Hm43 TaxID=3450742 RepID=UPI003F42E1AB
MLKNIEKFVMEKLIKDSTGHDWAHIDRVRMLAIQIGKVEGADLKICELAALVHDLIDDKLFSDEETALKEVIQLLKKEGIEKKEMDHIVEIITTMSFSSGPEKGMSTLEGEVVQDADRLDALGAIGIARTFMYSGAKGQAMYDPAIPARTQQMTKEEYRQGKSTSINHFYEKLFKLKDLMNTEEGIRLAEERHTFIEQFVEQFLAEWEGKDVQ